MLHLVATYLSLKAVSQPDWLVSHLVIGGLRVDTVYGLFDKCSRYVLLVIM